MLHVRYCIAVVLGRSHRRTVPLQPCTQVGWARPTAERLASAGSKRLLATPRVLGTQKGSPDSAYGSVDGAKTLRRAPSESESCVLLRDGKFSKGRFEDACTCCDEKGQGDMHLVVQVSREH